MSDTRYNIAQVFDSMRDMVLEKNKRYGDSAFHPASIFSKLSGEEAIRIRIDDKLKRIANSPELRKNDVSDVIGYLALLCVAKGWNNFDDLLD